MIIKPNLNQAEIKENYKDFLKLITTLFKGDRQEKLLKMYSVDELGNFLTYSPASTSVHFHSCWEGGYIQHIFNVFKAAVLEKELYTKIGCNIDFTDEEMSFVALQHNLGKLGDKEFGVYYVTTESWKQKKGELYQLNPNLPYMDVIDRTLLLLNKYGITMTWREFLGIKLSDGVFDEGAKKYYQQYNPDLYIRSNLPMLIHHAKRVSFQLEYDIWKNSKDAK